MISHSSFLIHPTRDGARSDQHLKTLFSFLNCHNEGRKQGRKQRKEKKVSSQISNWTVCLRLLHLLDRNQGQPMRKEYRIRAPFLLAPFVVLCIICHGSSKVASRDPGSFILHGCVDMRARSHRASEKRCKVQVECNCSFVRNFFLHVRGPPSLPHGRLELTFSRLPYHQQHTNNNSCPVHP